MNDVFVVHEDEIRFVDGLASEPQRSAAMGRVAHDLACTGELSMRAATVRHATFAPHHCRYFI